ncbi:fumarylacetoacetate hydrolase family protein [Algihabitans albus]|uniref:fumarylacetoacetate hydrolase family protein n=1 Tax=Algihabitans albus TaxID=2164067 RepID=UPI000E5D4F97|nr:fumarylacetoacetate hydrolase family protein [Algihabitans albus]
MRILTYREDEQERLALSIDDEIFDLAAVAASAKELKAITKPRFAKVSFDGLTMLGLIAMEAEGLDLLAELERYIHWQREADPWILRNAVRQEEEIEWLPPVTEPPAVYGIGGNSPLFFRDKGFQIPAYPRGFLRPTNAHALVGHRATVTLPASYATMRSSAEMGVVIGKTGRDVPESEAMDHVFGFTLVNDMCSDSWKTVALRGEDESRMHEDLTIFTQRAATSYYSRSTDSFAAIGPYIVTKEEVSDPYNLMVYNRLSGVQRERAYTQAMVNGVERTVSFLSRIFTLRPGMIFHLGTMGIDGYTVEADMFFDTDDYFEIEYESIGILRNYITDLRKP